MFATRVLLDLPNAAVIELIILAVAFVCVALASRVGMTLALLTPPVLLCAVTLIDNDFLYVGADRLDKIRVLALITALGLVLTQVSTTRATRSTTT